MTAQFQPGQTYVVQQDSWAISQYGRGVVLAYDPRTTYLESSYTTLDTLLPGDSFLVLEIIPKNPAYHTRLKVLTASGAVGLISERALLP